MLRQCNITPANLIYTNKFRQTPGNFDWMLYNRHCLSLNRTLNELMKKLDQQFPHRNSDYSCRPLLDHLAAELAKEYIQLMKESAVNNLNTDMDNDTCVLQFTPATAQKANVKRA